MTTIPMVMVLLAGLTVAARLGSETVSTTGEQSKNIAQSGVKETPTPATEDEVTRIRIIVTDDFEFAPTTLTVKRGVPVELELVSEDKYRKHGFKLAAFGVRLDLDPGSVNRVRFMPDQTGEFPFICDVFCGDGHKEMKGTLLVTGEAKPGESQ